MPTTQTVNSNYTGEAAGAIIGQAFKETSTVQRGLVTFMPNVRYKLSLKKIQYTNGKTDYSCGFTPAGAIVLSENQLTIKEIKNDLEICKDTFRATWDGLDNDMMEAIEVEVLANHSEAWDTEIWTGDSSTDGEFGGIIPQLEADDDVIKANNGIVPLEAAITKENVLAELEKVTAAFPVTIRKKPDFKVLVSANVADAYDKYLVSNGIQNGNGGGSMQSVYSKYTLEEVDTLPDNTIIAYQTRNVVVASSKSNSSNELTLVDTSETLLDGNIRGKVVYGADTGYYRGDEIVYYVSTEAVA
ncbi:hypothetical protein [Costertonia aggregata]|uniref:Phage major capsid protein n=1 Tax=Costertonia aggregata TaxID=343403 RepID=A0A7H9ARI6_9FLAO|nr:hypothetical protein [Costertonia aggregata]QLG46054.1 hypothetical protein HYG79_12095 [Costertonia aggregata]